MSVVIQTSSVDEAVAPSEATPCDACLREIERNGQMALRVAAEDGHAGCAQWLLQHEAEVDVNYDGYAVGSCQHGWTALHYAASRGRLEQAASVLRCKSAWPLSASRAPPTCVD